MKTKLIKPGLTGLTVVAAVILADFQATGADFTGSVQGAGKPIAGSTVTLYSAGAGAPTQLAQGRTDDNGAFTLAVEQTPADGVLYVIAKGGTPQAAADKSPNDAIALLAVLRTMPTNKIAVNEFTTVAS